MSRRPTTFKLFEVTVKCQVGVDTPEEAAAIVDAVCDFINDVYRTDEGKRISAFRDDGEAYDVNQ